MMADNTLSLPALLVGVVFNVLLLLGGYAYGRRVERRRCAKIARTSSFADGPSGTIESQIARAILALKEHP